MAVVVYVPSRLGEGFFTDLPAPTAGDDAKAITYDHGTGDFIYAPGATDHGALTGLADDDHSQYLLASGARTGATSQIQQFAYGAKSSVYRAIGTGQPGMVRGDSVLEFQKADGSNSFDIGAGVGQARFFAGAAFFTYEVQFYNNISMVNGGYLYRTTGPRLGIDSASITISNSTPVVGATWLDTGALALGGTHTPTALLDIAASTTTRASLRIRSGVAPTSPNVDGDLWNDGNAYAVMVNGTNAVNTDGGLSIWMQSSLQARNVGRVLWQYTDKTDATRVTKGALTAYYQSTERKAIHWSADVNGPTLSFGAVTTPIATPVLATGASATPDDIITVLQNLGLVKQS